MGGRSQCIFFPTSGECLLLCGILYVFIIDYLFFKYVFRLYSGTTLTNLCTTHKYIFIQLIFFSKLYRKLLRSYSTLLFGVPWRTPKSPVSNLHICSINLFNTHKLLQDINTTNEFYDRMSDGSSQRDKKRIVGKQKF